MLDLCALQKMELQKHYKNWESLKCICADNTQALPVPDHEKVLEMVVEQFSDVSVENFSPSFG